MCTITVQIGLFATRLDMVVGEFAVVFEVELAVLVEAELTACAEELHIHAEELGEGAHRRKTRAEVKVATANSLGVVLSLGVDHLYLEEDTVVLVVLEQEA